MRCRAALGLALALALTACGSSEPRMPSTCTDTDQAGYQRALGAVPGAVRLPGGTPISQCAWRVRSDAELQTLGTLVHVVAEDLAQRVRATSDPGAARQLGYLSGAVAAGAVHSNGIAAELARRVAVAAESVRDVSPAVGRALTQGQDAGQARG
ncbi:hypothetical protein [Baekduia soli]|uniref:hypothetical protein n=1 Tax=Baekduia soli TaxID=496014 RepID=UPI001651C9B9|nr:hypothetical protein [Baekduia soli]